MGIAARGDMKFLIRAGQIPPENNLHQMMINFLFTH
jgi:hypothetical protein